MYVLHVGARTVKFVHEINVCMSIGRLENAIFQIHNSTYICIKVYLNSLSRICFQCISYLIRHNVNSTAGSKPFVKKKYAALLSLLLQLDESQTLQLLLSGSLQIN